MPSRVYRATLFALYQLSIAFGIAAMPIAITAHRVGFTLPLHRVLAAVADAYEDARVE